MEEVLLFITDELPGIEAAIKKVYPRATSSSARCISCAPRPGG